MSALPSRADAGWQVARVCFGPKADFQVATCERHSVIGLG